MAVVVALESISTERLVDFEKLRTELSSWDSYQDFGKFCAEHSRF